MTRKKPQPSRKRKGRKPPLLLQPTAEGIAQTSRFRARKYELGEAQRGPTAPPYVTISVQASDTGSGGLQFHKIPSHRPFADQQPRILSQMEREDWRPKPPKLDPKTAEYLRMIAQGQAAAPPGAYSGIRGILGAVLGGGLG